MSEENKKTDVDIKPATTDKITSFIEDLLKFDTTTLVICGVILLYSIFWPLWPWGGGDFKNKNKVNCNNLEFITCESSKCNWHSGVVKNMEECLAQDSFTIPTAQKGKITCDDIFTYNKNQRLLKSTAINLIEAFKKDSYNQADLRQNMQKTPPNQWVNFSDISPNLQNAIQNADGTPAFKEVAVPLPCKIAYP